MKNKYWGYQTDDIIRIPVPVIVNTLDQGAVAVSDSNNGNYKFAQRWCSSFFAKKGFKFAVHSAWQ
jgi:hypothetical protein